MSTRKRKGPAGEIADTSQSSLWQSLQTEEDVNKLAPKQLNHFCKQHGISGSENRRSKIAKICSILGIDVSNLSDFSKILQAIKAEKKGWTKDIRKLPLVNLSTVTSYLIRAHDTHIQTKSGTIEEWTSETLTRYRALRSYLHFDAGHVHSMEYHPMPDSEFCAVRALCNPSYDSSGTMHHPIVVLRKNSDEPVGAHCSCQAGLGEACTHTAAILWALEDFTTRGYQDLPDNPASTEILSKWTDPKNAKVEALPLRDVTFKQANPFGEDSKRQQKPMYDFEAVAPLKRKPNVDNYHALIQRLNVHRPRIPFLLIADPCKHGNPSVPVAQDPVKMIPPVPPCQLPFDATELVPAAECTVNTTDREPSTLREKTEIWLQNIQTQHSSRSQAQIHSFVESLTCTEEDQQTVNNLTLGQANNPKWHAHRVGMITGTTIRKVYTKMASISKGKNHRADELVKTILGDTKFKGNRATQYGVANEKNAVEKYVSLQADKHRNLKVLEAGLLVYTKHSFIGGSPDGIITCDCHPNSLLEVKCPLTLKDKPVEDFIHPFLKVGSPAINKNHAFYGQIQANMAVACLQTTDFVMWSPKGCHIITIPFDHEHWNDLLTSAISFFREYVAPVLLEKCDLRTKFVQCRAARETVKHKICGGCNLQLNGPNDVTSVMCECQDCDCQRWFHISCTNHDLDYFEEEEEACEWYCPKCVRNCDIIM